jgi:transcriptional regulator with XRE-family HTH domain
MTLQELETVGGSMSTKVPHQALIDWLKDELGRRNLSQSEAARRAGLSPNTINQIYNGVQPGLRACIALANYFDVPITRVLYMAGHISKEEMEGRDKFAERVLPFWDKMTPEQRESLISFLRTIVGDVNGD